MRAVGRLVNHCPHDGGWASDSGEQRCNACGTRRFTDYRGVWQSGLPETVTPSEKRRPGADRSAATAIANRFRLRRRFRGTALRAAF
ncbi:DUF6255 family natural product biosynthesis protein [Streptomyces sp. NPDC037389]|uniref:DUF6255 family natural product biosynthesis protein n=1 Tax=Streptomyces sp. NPDC037389 TaxID=3155369 RepID=UPI003402128B